jgi:NAD(P)-dependent dehydrogenase (short-subunit alcohol dehydrogenase family)
MDQNQNALNVEESVLRKAMDLNFFATVNTTQAFVPLLLKGTDPIVVMVSTDMASNTIQAKPNSFLHVTAYNTSKAALNSYAIALAAELKDKVRVNAVTPGFTSTKLNNFGEGGKTPAQGAAIIAKYALLDQSDKTTGKLLMLAHSGRF